MYHRKKAEKTVVFLKKYNFFDVNPVRDDKLTMLDSCQSRRIGTNGVKDWTKRQGILYQLDIIS